MKYIMREKMYSFLNEPIFKLIQQSSDELNVDTYAIGGYVRDFFLERKSLKKHYKQHHNIPPENSVVFHALKEAILINSCFSTKIEKIFKICYNQAGGLCHQANINFNLFNSRRLRMQY